MWKIIKSPLNKELHKILTGMSKRNNNDYVIWYDCSIAPEIGGTWECHVCNCKFSFIEGFGEIFVHGYEHLKNKNLLPFI